LDSLLQMNTSSEAL